MSYFSDKMATRTRSSYAGVIRPGIQKLTRGAQDHPRAQEIRAIFNRADAGEIRFEEAKKEIEKRTGLANALHPSNAPFFSVFATDFTVPEHAHLLLEKYGEDRGDGRRLYRFPVVFSTVDIDRILPGGFKRPKGEPAYFSTQGNDGVRYCTYYEHLKPEQIQEQRRQRIIQVRPEPKIRGQCNPATCQEFTEGSCRFSGELTFYIPGLPIGGLLKLTTGSEYASEAIYMELARIKEVLGTIPQVHPFQPGIPPFMIAKELQTRSYYDARTGERKRAENWVPILVPAFDMGALVSGAAPLLERRKTPQAWLAADSTLPSAPTEPMVQASSLEDHGYTPQGEDLRQHDHGQPNDEHHLIDMPEDRAPFADGVDPRADMNGDLGPRASVIPLGDLVDLSKPEIAAWVEALGGHEPAERIANSLANMGDGVLSAHIAISGMVRSSGIAKEAFQVYMTQRYGKGWAKNASVYKDALANIQSMKHDGSLQHVVAASQQ